MIWKTEKKTKKSEQRKTNKTKTSGRSSHHIGKNVIPEVDLNAYVCKRLKTRCFKNMHVDLYSFFSQVHFSHDSYTNRCIIV